MNSLKKAQRHLLNIILVSAISFSGCLYVYVTAWGHDEIISAAYFKVIGGLYVLTTTASLFLSFMSLVDMKKQLRSVLDLAATPSHMSDVWAFESIMACQDDEWRLLVARVCATGISNQGNLENLIVRLSQDNAGQEIIQVFLDRLHKKFDTSLERHFKDFLTEAEKGKPWSQSRTEGFFRLLNNMIFLDGTNYAKIESIGAATAVFLRDYPIRGMSLSDRMNKLFSVQEMENNEFSMDGHKMSAFLRGVWKEVYSENSVCLNNSIQEVAELAEDAAEEHF